VPDGGIRRRHVVETVHDLRLRAAGDVGGDVEKLMANMKLPPGYRFYNGGQQQDMNESMQAALAALGLAVIFIYLILASQFGSFLQPVAIMMSLPMSLVGVFLGLLIAGTTLNIFSAIGFIMLMGLVTKNAILLVDFFNQARERGVPVDEALLEAGSIRLRPILMTTLAMVFGMMPLALGLGEGASQRAPMAHAVIGGLISSTRRWPPVRHWPGLRWSCCLQHGWRPHRASHHPCPRRRRSS